MTEKKMAVRPQDVNHEANAQEFMFRAMLNKNAFIQIVRVDKVKYISDDEPPLVNLTPLVLGFSGEGTPIENSQVFNIPVWRLQRGSSALIMDPVVDDIGLMLCCDRDTSRVRETKKEDMPGSSRTHNEADGVYLGGMLNASPMQYVRFADDGISIVSPLVVTVESPTVEINASTSVTLNSSNIVLNGPVSQGAGSYAGDFNFKGNITAEGEVTGKGIKLSDHVHNGVQTGSGNTGKPQ
ncbi:phage baseplate assembly protein [Pantoea trifolii]|uniref:phage baseplate assembly protein n=1 Tax=Candidatus Pantoea symbiotica TaxID=1884370 RepID=UPI0024136DB9|nr:phage baseplate assembly protein [Pantoea rodasii]